MPHANPPSSLPASLARFLASCSRPPDDGSRLFCCDHHSRSTSSPHTRSASLSATELRGDWQVRHLPSSLNPCDGRLLALSSWHRERDSLCVSSWRRGPRLGVGVTAPTPASCARACFRRGEAPLFLVPRHTRGLASREVYLVVVRRERDSR
jgi:hypothetical protein